VEGCLTCEELVGVTHRGWWGWFGRLLSKGAIFTSLFSSNEPEFDDLDALFEDEI